MSEYNLKVPKKVEDAVVGTYKKIEDAVVGTYQRIENAVVGAYEKVEAGAVDGYKKVEKKFVGAFLENAGRSEEPSAQEEGGPADSFQDRRP